MNRVKKWTSITAALFLMVVSILIVGFNLKPINANAQIRNFTVEEYTNDDRLLKSDGQLSVRTIRNFANDVNAGILRAGVSRTCTSGSARISGIDGKHRYICL